MRLYLFLAFLAFIPFMLAFDFFIFSQTWTPTFCKINPQKCLESPVENFVIHGLWPQYDNNSYPQYCKPCEKFNKTFLDNKFHLQLEKYWSDTGIIDWDFLEHEWEKHGCCSEMEIDEYFDKILKFRKNWDYKKVFESIGIYPNTTIYLERIKTAAIDFCGNRCNVAFECIHNHLMTMFISLSRNMEEIKKNMTDNCDEKFIW